MNKKINEICQDFYKAIETGIDNGERVPADLITDYYMMKRLDQIAEKLGIELELSNLILKV